MKQITIALNKEQFTYLEKLAEKEGLSVYAFCKAAVLNEISERGGELLKGEEFSELKEMKRELSELRKLVKSKL